MKILIVNKFLYPNGGSETYIFKIGEQLERMGNKVQFFGMDHDKRIVGNEVQSYTSNMDFHTSKLAKLKYPFKIIYSFEAKKKIRLVLNDFKPDVVHLNNFNFQITPSIIYEIRNFEKKFNKKITIVYTAHDYQWVCPNHMMLIPSSKERCYACKDGRFINCTKNKCIHNTLIKSILGSIEGYFYHFLKTYKLVDTIICPSEFLNKQLSMNKIIASKTVTLHNFVDMDETEQLKEMKQNKKDYIVYFGRYSEEKGIRTLLKVCRLLPDISFVFAGSGPLLNEVNSIENIENRGFLSGEELKKLVEQAKFSVFPSEWYENCPFSVMESQMYGTPIIASNLGGTPELVKDGVTGELFEAGNEKQLVNKIKSLWNDDSRCNSYAQNCKRNNFDSLKIYSEKLLNIYRNNR